MTNVRLLIAAFCLMAFFTADAATAFRFVAWADTESGNSILTSASKEVNDLNPKFTLYPGDLIKCYGDKSPQNPGCFSGGFSSFKSALNGGGTNTLFDKTFATRGNHEDNADTPWKSNFEFATVASTVGATNYVEQAKDMTYSFDYDNSHFVGIDMTGGDTKTMTAAQINWLDADLAAAEGRGLTHAFIFWHGPIYPVGKHCCTQGATTSLANVLKNHPIISAGFFGHEMVLTYTHIDSGRISGIATANEFEQFVVGNVGDGNNANTVKNNRVDYASNAAFGFVSVDVSGNDFTVSLYKLSGASASVVKVFSFSKASSTVVSTPTFLPPAGTYPSTQSVTITTATSGTTIRYTLDGTDPTTTSAQYLTPITVSSTTTIKAKAWKTGMTESGIASATYYLGTPILSSIEVTPQSAMVNIGSSQQFTAQPKDQFGNDMSASVTWSSSNPLVGTIVPGGIFSALSLGTSTVTASSGAIAGTATANVRDPNDCIPCAICNRFETWKAVCAMAHQLCTFNDFPSNFCNNQKNSCEQKVDSLIERCHAISCEGSCIKYTCTDVAGQSCDSGASCQAGKTPGTGTCEAGKRCCKPQTLNLQGLNTCPLNDFPLRIYVPVFEGNDIDAAISRAKIMNADALLLAMDGPMAGSTHFSVADFAKANNIKNNNGITIKPVLWTDITMSHSTYVVINMNDLANRDAAIAQLEQDIINHPGIYAVELEETGHAGYTTAAMNDLLTKARDVAHNHGVQLWINQPTMGPWSETPPIAGWDVDYINGNVAVDAYILQNGDLGATSTGGVGTLAAVLDTQNTNQDKMPNINVFSGAYGWAASSTNTAKCVAYRSAHADSWGIPECWVQSLFTTVDYFNSRGMPVQIAQVNWGTSADYFYYDTAGYGTGTVLEVMSRIPVNYAASTGVCPCTQTSGQTCETGASCPTGKTSGTGKCITGQVCCKT